MTSVPLLQSLADPLAGTIAIPLVGGVACALCPDRWRVGRVALAVVTAAAAAWLAARGLEGGASVVAEGILAADPLSSLCSVGAAIATVLVAVFMFGWSDPRAEGGHRLLLSSICATLGAANAVFFAADLLLLLVAWGSLAVLLYLMVVAAGPGAGAAARKAALIVGGADAALLLGLLLLSGGDVEGRVVTEALPDAAGPVFGLIAVAALAKLGAVPFHGWVAPVASKAHAPAAALLLGAVDKLLGGYLLVRLVGDRASVLLLVIGAASIVIGMLYAVTDRDAKRVLAYSGVAQVGFVLLGLGSGTAIGRAGALFHLLNNALYKPALFLTTGAVQRRMGTTDLRELGGLARVMPWAFGATIVCGLALAGVPPLNGFFSKWMLYQGLFEATGDRGPGWAIGLLVAMTGSALTLAAVARLIHAIYLRKASGDSRPASAAGKDEDSRWGKLSVVAPPMVAAVLSVVLGIFAEQMVLRPLVLPATAGDVAFIGTWWSGTAALLLGAAVAFGGLLYWGSFRKVRRSPAFVGGEDLRRVRTTDVPATPDRDVEVSGADFFETLRELRGLRRFYEAAERGWLDLAAVIGRLVSWPVELTRRAHGGVLSTYATWIIVGLCAVLVLLGGLR